MLGHHIRWLGMHTSFANPHCSVILCVFSAAYVLPSYEMHLVYAQKQDARQAANRVASRCRGDCRF